VLNPEGVRQEKNRRFLDLLNPEGMRQEKNRRFFDSLNPEGTKRENDEDLRPESEECRTSSDLRQEKNLVLLQNEVLLMNRRFFDLPKVIRLELSATRKKIRWLPVSGPLGGHGRARTIMFTHRFLFH